MRRAGKDGRYYLPTDAERSYLFGLSSARVDYVRMRALHSREVCTGERRNWFGKPIEHFRSCNPPLPERQRDRERERERERRRGRKARRASRACVVLVTGPACRVTVSRHLAATAWLPGKRSRLIAPDGRRNRFSRRRCISNFHRRALRQLRIGNTCLRARRIRLGRIRFQPPSSIAHCPTVDKDRGAASFNSNFPFRVTLRSRLEHFKNLAKRGNELSI